MRLRPPQALISALATTLAGAFPVVAQDDGQTTVAQPYVVEGPGRASCADFSAQDPAGDDRRMAAAWLTGYLTAHHRLLPDIYDLSPWQSPGLMLSLLDQFCTANPDAVVENAAQALVGYLGPRALTEPAEIVAVESGGSVTLIYLPVLAEVRAALAEAGHPAGPAAEDLPPALRAYQQAEGLSPTGLPDQPTLARLLD